MDIEKVVFHAIAQFLALAQKEAVQNREVGDLRKSAIKECADKIRILQKQNEQQRPEVSIANKAQTELRAWAKELGLTPAARQRMKEAGNASESGIDPELDGMVAHD